MCTFCGVHFKDIKTLRCHHKTDHSYEYHECQQCKQFFTSLDSLQGHQELYIGLAVLQCGEQNCGENFHTKWELLNHTYMEHMDMKCIICAQGLTSGAGFIVHLKQTHGADSIEEVKWRKGTKKQQAIQGHTITKLHTAKEAQNVLYGKQLTEDGSESNSNTCLSVDNLVTVTSDLEKYPKEFQIQNTDGLGNKIRPIECGTNIFEESDISVKSENIPSGFQITNNLDGNTAENFHSTNDENNKVKEENMDENSGIPQFPPTVKLEPDSDENFTTIIKSDSFDSKELDQVKPNVYKTILYNIKALPMESYESDSPSIKNEEKSTDSSECYTPPLMCPNNDPDTNMQDKIVEKDSENIKAIPKESNENDSASVKNEDESRDSSERCTPPSDDLHINTDTDMQAGNGGENSDVYFLSKFREICASTPPVKLEVEDVESSVDFQNICGDANGPTINIKSENSNENKVDLFDVKMDENHVRNSPVPKEENDLKSTVSPQLFATESFDDSNVVSPIMDSEVFGKSPETVTGETHFQLFPTLTEQISFQPESQNNTSILQLPLVGALPVNTTLETVPVKTESYIDENHYETGPTLTLTSTSLEAVAVNDEIGGVDNPFANFPTPIRKDGSRPQSCCGFCAIHFVSEKHFWQHVNSYHPMCTDCVLFFKDAKSLQTHKVVKHTFRACLGCNLSFRSDDDFKKHTMSLQGSKLFHCKESDCQQIFHTKEEYSEHFYEDHAMNKCIICAQGISGNTTLEQHLRNVHQTDTGAFHKKSTNTLQNAMSSDGVSKISVPNANNFLKPDQNISQCYCNFCNIKFITGQHLKWHYWSHHPYCDKCRVFVRNVESFQSHERSVHKLPSCSLCKKCFASYHALSNHIRSCQYMSAPVVQCPENKCEMIFHTKMELHIHRKEHIPFSRKCVICGKCMMGKSTIKAHLQNSHQVEIINGQMSKIPATITITPKVYTLNVANTEQSTSSALNIEPPSAKKTKTDSASQSSIHGVSAGEKAIMCSKCLTCFNNKVQWERHMLKFKKT